MPDGGWSGWRGARATDAYPAVFYCAMPKTKTCTQTRAVQCDVDLCETYSSSASYECYCSKCAAGYKFTDEGPDGLSYLRGGLCIAVSAALRQKLTTGSAGLIVVLVHRSCQSR